MSKAGQPSELSKSDRMELRRVVKERYELLGEQMEVRKREVRNAIQRQIEIDSSKAIKEAEKRGRVMAKELEKALVGTESLLAEMNEQGIEPKGSREFRYYISEAIDSLKGEWKITDLQSRTSRLFTVLEQEHGTSQLSLRQQRLTLLEDLSIDALETKKAKELFERIPSVDDFMPLPQGKTLKELVA